MAKRLFVGIFDFLSMMGGTLMSCPEVGFLYDSNFYRRLQVECPGERLVALSATDCPSFPIIATLVVTLDAFRSTTSNTPPSLDLSCSALSALSVTPL